MPFKTLTAWLCAFLPLLSLQSLAQQQHPYTATFVAKMGADTVSVETYTVLHNHLYGKAFIRVPEDYIGEFTIHFYPDGTIREFSVVAKDPRNSSVPFEAKTGYFPYRLNMNCRNDSCIFFNAEKGKAAETVLRHAAPAMDFVGGWVPLISLMEWNSLRLWQSGIQRLPLRMINDGLGVYPIAIEKKSSELFLFGGPFIEYTKIIVDENGRIRETNGLGTPWNYTVTKHPPMDVDLVARRLSQTKGIGVPSPDDTIRTRVKGSTLAIKYGRPLKRGRQVFGNVVPFDSLWRTGANGPTTVMLENDLQFAGTLVPKGAYSLYTVPGKSAWTLIFNKDLQRWPTDPNRQADFASVRMQTEKAKEIAEQFTIRITETKNGGLLQFHWDDTMASVAFEVIKN